MGDMIMDLNVLWFGLIAFLYIGFFVLEGFDFGVGILLPFLGKNDTERRVLLNTIGPHWDGNEVWLITAGAATFAAFPHWYATMFSGFYPALLLLLCALIVRGIAIEFRSKHEDQTWRNTWDWGVFGGSLLSAFLLGVAFANLAKGVPIDRNMTYTGTFLTLLNPYGLIGGVNTVVCFTLIGALFLSRKTTNHLATRSHVAARRLWWPAGLIATVLLVATFFYTDLNQHAGIDIGIIIFMFLGSLSTVGYFINRRRNGWAFGMMGFHIALTLASCFWIMFPRVMISTLDPAFSLTIYTAASSPYTLKIITVVALIFVPLILMYQGWTYWVFRKRIGTTPQELTY
jgi:cytochrome d ubiquinol oxidase subunit II